MTAKQKMSPESVAWHLKEAYSEPNAYELISEAVDFVRRRRADLPESRARDMMAEGLAMYAECCDFYQWAHCPECGEERQPATSRQLKANARLYVDFFLDHCSQPGGMDDFNLCGACGGRLPLSEHKED